MIGNSLPEYLFIRASISVVRLVAPASILYLAACAYTQSFLISPVITVIAAAEALFYTVIYLPRKRRLQRPPTYTPPILTRLEREALFSKCCEDLSYISLHGQDVPYPKGWFLPHHTGSEYRIRRQDVVEWLLWSLFSSPPEDLQEEWTEELNTYVAMVEKLLGETLSDDMGTSSVRSMRLTLDPVKMAHRPLIWYAIVCLVDTITTLNLFRLGFKHYSSTHKWFQTFPPRPVLSLFSKNAHLTPDILLPYWYRPHKSVTKLPIVFLHGIGIGLHPYIPFIRDIISQDPDVGILLIEFLPMSMHMTVHPVPPAPLIASALNNILDTLNIPRIVLMAHSYGTFVSSCVLRDSCNSKLRSQSNETTLAPHPLLPKLAHTLLIDPIPFLLHLPPVAHNFLHRSPSAAAEWQLWYFASSDPDVARTLGRAFFWTEGIAWKDNLRCWMRAKDTATGRNGEDNVTVISEIGPKRRRNVTVSLSGKDQIMPAECVRRYLTEEEEPSARWVGRSWVDWGADHVPTSVLLSGERDASRGLVAGVVASDDLSSDSAAEEGRGNESTGNLEVLFYPELDHATVFDTRERRVPMLDVLWRYVRDI